MRDGNVLLHAYGTRARGLVIKVSKEVKKGLDAGMSVPGTFTLYAPPQLLTHI